MIKLTIPEIPPSLNKYLRMHYQTRKRVNDHWAEIIWHLKLEQRYTESPLKKSKVTLIYYFPDKKRRDPDNYAGKMIMDGLTRARIIEDDSFDNVILEIKAKVDKRNPRVEVEIWEVSA